jgi:hypothetical protein
MPHIFSCPTEASMSTYLRSLASWEGIVMSAEIIPFVRDRRRDRVRHIGSRSLATPDDLVMDHLDTAPCEAAWLKVPQAESYNG